MEISKEKTTEIKAYKKTGKYIVIAGAVFVFCVLLALMGYRITHNSDIGGWQQSLPSPEATQSIDIKINK